MFDDTFDQAHGLQRWALQPPTRVVPVVLTDDDPLSLELIWALERGWKAQGLEVTVVEGLQGLAPQDAALGHQAVLRRWLAGVPQGSVVLLHAPLDAMAVLLADSLARPLVALRPDRRGVVQAYNTIKVLVQAAGLQPVAVWTGVVSPQASAMAADALRETCRTHLDMVPGVWSLEYHGKQIGAWNQGLDACLLKVLDSALTLDVEESRTRQHDAQRFEHRQFAADQIIGVSDVHRQRHTRP